MSAVNTVLDKIEATISDVGLGWDFFAKIDFLLLTYILTYSQ